MKIVIKLLIFFVALGVIFIVSSQPALAKSSDATWVTGVADFEIWDSSTLSWDADSLVCSAQLTDDNAQTIGCTGGVLATSHTYRIQVVVKEGPGETNALEGKNTTSYVGHMATKGGWAGTNPTPGSCGYNDFAEPDDDIGPPACSAAFVGNDLQLNNPSGGGGNKVIIADDGGIEGFMYIITTDSDATSASTSYMYIFDFGQAQNEDSSKIGINVTPSSLTCNFSTTTASFGTLTTNAVTTAYGSTTIDITSPTTVFVKLYDTGGGGGASLYYSGGDNIGSADFTYADTATLEAGTEGYGMQATTTGAGSGAVITILNRYDNASTTNDVGALELVGAEVTMASSTAAVTNRRIIMYYKAAINASHEIGSYLDTLTYTCSTSQ